MPRSLTDTTTRALDRPEDGWLPGPLRPAVVVVACPSPAWVGRRIWLDPGIHVFGRSAPADVLVEDAAMSRRHFALEVAEGGIRLRDFASRNGTYLDGTRVEGEHRFEAGVIRAGSTILVWDAPVSKASLPRVADGVGEAVTEIEGWSLATRALRDAVATVSRPGGTVLVLGPTGTGKEVTARAVHAHSDREGPFVAINCAAIPDALAESELFGHVQGAFTGATSHRSGAFREAHGGTLFLDEVGDLSPAVQAKLLRVLEDRRVRPLGGNEAPQEVDVRVVAATRRELVDAEAFREDLRARLSDWVLRLPPLQERPADVLALLHHFAAAEGRDDVRWPLEMQEAFLTYPWPLNVRELQRLVRRTLALTARAEAVDPEVLPEDLQALLLEGRASKAQASPRPESSSGSVEGPSSPAPTAPELAQALQEVGGNVRLLSERKGWHRSQIYRWLKRFEMDLADFR